MKYISPLRALSLLTLVSAQMFTSACEDPVAPTTTPTLISAPGSLEFPDTASEAVLRLSLINPGSEVITATGGLLEDDESEELSIAVDEVWSGESVTVGGNSQVQLTVIWRPMDDSPDNATINLRWGGGDLVVPVTTGQRLVQAAGEEAGEPAGEEAGEPAGEEAGEPAGEEAGEPAGEAIDDQTLIAAPESLVFPDMAAEEAMLTLNLINPGVEAITARGDFFEDDDLQELSIIVDDMWSGDSVTVEGRSQVQLHIVWRPADDLPDVATLNLSWDEGALSVPITTGDHLDEPAGEEAGEEAGEPAGELAGGEFLDGDGDGVNDDIDNCPMLANENQEDQDGDGAGDVCDATPDVFNYKLQGARLVQGSGSGISGRYKLRATISSGAARGISQRYKLKATLSP